LFIVRQFGCQRYLDAGIRSKAAPERREAERTVDLSADCRARLFFAVAGAKFRWNATASPRVVSNIVPSKGSTEEESNMRTTAKSLAVLGVIGAAALSVPSVASAQGIYFGVPGFGVGIGAPYYYGGGPYYGYYDQPYGYGYGYGHHWYPHRYHHWHHY